MANFNYERIRKTFYADSTLSPEVKKSIISGEINIFLDNYGNDGWELVHYNELLLDEGTSHVTAVFKKPL